MVVVLLMLGAVVLVSPRPADAVGSVVISEVVASNSTYVDRFDGSSDWFELHNSGSSAITMTGWTLSDGSNAWILPTTSLAADERLVVRASGRDLAEPEFHSSFSLDALGETLTLSDADGALADSITWPSLTTDQGYGIGSDGVVGFLQSTSPGRPNAALLPSQVSIATPAQNFENSLDVEMSAVVAAGEDVRYTVDGTPVNESSPLYSGPFEIKTSTVVRAAVVGGGLSGPESSVGYTRISPTIAKFTSNLPIVLIHSTGVVDKDSLQDSIVTVIAPDADGRAGVFDEAQHNGFAGLRIRGASSSTDAFPKKQYKLELWSDRKGTELDADLLGLGADSDWVLYAPGRFDRAMINNPFMYELGHRLGVVAPDYQFVELFAEDNPSATIGDGDYLGLYVLRENIKVGSERVDITPHSPTAAAADFGYIVRYDWADDCCAVIDEHPEFSSKIAVDSPGLSKLTTEQQPWIDKWWDEVQKASKTGFAEADEYIDFDSFIDAWLLEMLALDVDILRASHYMHKDAGGQLEGGPLWDYDRALGGADHRVDDISEAQTWASSDFMGHSYQSDIYADVWQLPEVQARLRARWAELRAAELSDFELTSLIDTMGATVGEAYVREDARWGDDGFSYGSRFGDYQGELDHMKAWVTARTAWLDSQFIADGEGPVLADLDTVQASENNPILIEVVAKHRDTVVFTAKGLPKGLAIDPSKGTIGGIVGIGDGGSYRVSITVTDSQGRAATTEVIIEVAGSFAAPGAVLLNEYNAVNPGSLLVDGGADGTFGRAGGNGGDWFEIVTLDDHLDMTGWKFDIWHKVPVNGLVQTASLELADAPLLSDVRAGTILTVAESVPDDLSYDPENGDWTIGLQSNNAQAGALFDNQTNFDTNNNKWRLVVRDSTGVVRAAIAGETAPWDSANLGVADDEVFALRADPSYLVDVVGDYSDTNESTFGAPNLIGGVAQDFSNLRPTFGPVGVKGDVNCDGFADVIDSLFISQFEVGVRTAVPSCPLTNRAQELVLASGDTNGDAFVDVIDALFISQCDAGVTNPFCP